MRTLIVGVTLFMAAGDLAAAPPLPSPRKPVSERQTPTKHLEEHKNIIPSDRYPPAYSVYGALLHPNGETIIARTGRGGGIPRHDPLIGTTAFFWRFNISDGIPERLDGLTHGPDAALSFDGRKLLIPSHSSELFLGDPLAGKDFELLDEGVGAFEGGSPVFLDNRRVLLAASNAWHVLDTETGQEIARWPRVSNGFIVGASGRGLLAVWESHRIVMVDSYTGAVRGQWLLPIPARRYTSAQRALAFSPSGRYLAAFRERAVYLFDVLSGEELPPVTHEAEMRAVRFSLDEKQLWSWHADAALRTWSVSQLSEPIARIEKLAGEYSATELCDMLLGDDAWRAYCARRMLPSRQKEVLNVLRARVTPPAPLTAAQVDAILRQMCSEDFNERRRAAERMAGHEEQIVEGAHAFYSSVIETNDEDLRRRAGHLLHLPLRIRRTDSRDSPHHLIQFLPLFGVSGQEIARDLAGGYSKATLTEEAQELLAKWPAEEQQEQSKAGDFDELLTALSGDGPQVWAAIRELARTWPRQREKAAAELLRLSSDPALADPAANVPQWIRQLDADDFAARERASQELARLGQQIVPQLSAALAKSQSSEAKQRLSTLLKKPGMPQISGLRLRALRLVEAGALSGADNIALWRSVARDSKNPWLREMLQDNELLHALPR